MPPPTKRVAKACAKSGPEPTQLSDSLRSIPIADVALDCPMLLYTVIGRPHSPAAAALIQLMRAANWKQIVADSAIAGAAFARMR